MNAERFRLTLSKESKDCTFLQDGLLEYLQKENMVVGFKTVFALHKPACGVWMPFNF